MLNSITHLHLFQPAIHTTFHKLIAENYLEKKSTDLNALPIEVKYALIELSSLGVLRFTEERIEVAQGMSSWMKNFWSEVSARRE